MWTVNWIHKREQEIGIEKGDRNIKIESAKKYRVVSDEARSKQKNVRKGYLSELINEVKRRRKIEHISIPLKTIYQRAYRKQSDIHHCPGHISPYYQLKTLLFNSSSKWLKFVRASHLLEVLL